MVTQGDELLMAFGVMGGTYLTICPPLSADSYAVTWRGVGAGSTEECSRELTLCRFHAASVSIVLHNSISMILSSSSTTRSLIWS